MLVALQIVIAIWLIGAVAWMRGHRLSVEMVIESAMWPLLVLGVAILVAIEMASQKAD